ncbi:kinetochore complex Sim4 subunit Fta1-domain-containing protein [Paraphoma chrysanthemicola]|uniref:Kinetochore complex Sim4 subunit Fta1-domain-containing protein n=1 Tax=Paraphoma chrysanthemicola TaxID=798071 RepID=A0A8K0R4B1_9PLEO|nr:kinetochore complex Sim4 subunit Fta1-domain-containing protein [Paraphoma chrysanthemicola]
MADIPPYPLYHRTYSLYRLSPLHHGDTPLLDDRSLRTHAKRLREQLKGDNVRGVQVDFAAAEDTAKLGPLEECAWETIGDEDAWIDRHRTSVEPDASQLSAALTPDRVRGIEVSLEYEKQAYNALLLRDPGVTSSPDGFTSLPLLLVKMPGPIRETFLNYLRTAFDAHVAPLRLPSTFITSSLETYFTRLTSGTSTQSIKDVVRQLHVQLAFPATTTLLKHIELTIAGADVPGFVSRGKLMKGGQEKPFTVALLAYLKSHLALDLSHSKAHISRISCNSFHLGTERLKLAAPDQLADTSFSDEGGASQDLSASQLAVQDFYASLVREAAGSGKFLPEGLSTGYRDDTPSSTASAKAVRRKRAISSTAVSNSKQKKAKPRGKENGRQTNGDDEMADA